MVNIWKTVAVATVGAGLTAGALALAGEGAPAEMPVGHDRFTRLAGHAGEDLRQRCPGDVQGDEIVPGMLHEVVNGDGGHGTTRRAPDLLSHHGRPRDARGSRARHPHAQARCAHPSSLENRSALRSHATDSASAVTAGVLELSGWGVSRPLTIQDSARGCGRQSQAIRSPGSQSAEALA